MNLVAIQTVNHDGTPGPEAYVNPEYVACVEVWPEHLHCADEVSIQSWDVTAISMNGGRHIMTRLDAALVRQMLTGQL